MLFLESKQLPHFVKIWHKEIRKYPNIGNILSKAMRNISLNVNCAVKRSQNLQISEFKKAQEIFSIVSAETEKCLVLESNHF